MTTCSTPQSPKVRCFATPANSRDGGALEEIPDRMRQAVGGHSGRAAMVAGDHKLRITLAIFKSVGSLVPAIERLMDTGVSLSSLGLILLAATARRMTTEVRAEDRLDHPLARLLASVDRLAGSREGDILASPGVTEPWFAGLSAPGLWAEGPSPEPGPRLAADLERHVREGAAVLTVVSPSPTEHWHCARILLEQSCAPILALECSLPAAT